MKAFRRVVLIVLDGVGIGALPDAAAYGDAGANTLRHVAEAVGGLTLPHLCRLGLGRVIDFPGASQQAFVAGAAGRMAERAAGKDSTAGHWELMGVILDRPLPTFPEGFPPAIIEAFEAQTGLKVLGNVAASGTEIIDRLGEEHMRTGRPIVYTSVDSVFQVAAHEEVIPVDRLYELCRTARRILDPWRVGRVIARPFVGDPEHGFRRTARRHDFSLAPVGTTVLDRLAEKRVAVCGIGKIGDLYAGRGLSEQQATASNAEGMERILAAIGRLDSGVIFANLVDFDMLWGHRLDAAGFAAGLEAFDRWLGELFAVLEEDDLLMITADHGCDPTTPSTDHSREYVPLLCWHAGMRGRVDLGLRGSFADVGATLAEAMGVESPCGESFLVSLFTD
ncbi:phosphopentomutase [Geothermobacter ehrlichii]|uniref:Phosphopentomutase n=1 Tax=Geothermobacter ehrlichii TaxID=213224 RepID=A0A5D3WJL3_9BACT|nr:phosphopentomutase [Geothermobacter ehrlichii]TYO98237.1 phosphopentomutase [Geothermobacter ehrlichii]